MASRNSLNSSQSPDSQEVVEHDDRFNEILPVIVKSTPKTLVCDFDSLIYWTLVEYNEDKTRKELTLEHLPDLQGKLSEMVTGILNKLYDKFLVKNTYIFIRGSNNYRKSLYKEYKSNRPEKHFLVNYLYDYLKESFGALE